MMFHRCREMRKEAEERLMKNLPELLIKEPSDLVIYWISLIYEKFDFMISSIFKIISIGAA
jgi:hypothetical protein